MGIKTRSSKVRSFTGRGGGAGTVNGGWSDAPTEFLQRCVLMSIWGPTGSGRTHLALTAPGPIRFAHAGEKIQGVVQAAAREKPVQVMNFGGIFTGSEQEISDQAAPIWSELLSGVNGSLADIDVRTTIIDTDTEAWELERLAFFGELNPKGRTDSLYGPVNARWRSMFKSQRASYNNNEANGVYNTPNFIVIGQAKDEYAPVVKDGKKSSEKTGRLIQAGQKEVAFSADVVIETGRDLSNGDFVAWVRKGWWNAAEAEQFEFRNEDIRFSYIMACITKTEESEWL